MLNLLATEIGESPATTVYNVSSPTAPDGSVVVVPGAVLATGGIVAKFVGVTFTTVVATPSVSPPHAEPKSDAATRQVATVKDFPTRRRTDELNTRDNSRCCDTSKGVASITRVDELWEESEQEATFHP